MHVSVNACWKVRNFHADLYASHANEYPIVVIGALIIIIGMAQMHYKHKTISKMVHFHDF